MRSKLTHWFKNPIFSFLGKGAIVFLVYILIYEGIVHQFTRFEDHFTSVLILISANLLKALGYKNVHYGDFQVGVNTDSFVYVGSGCIGVDLMFLFAGFIIAYKGGLKDKILFILAGSFIIQIVNVIRIAALAIIFYHWPEYLNFNHKYTFTLVMYLIIFGMWVYWVKRLNKKSDATA